MFQLYDSAATLFLATDDGIPLAFENMFCDAESGDGLRQMLDGAEWDGEVLAERFNEAYETGLINCFHWQSGFWDDYEMRLEGEDILATHVVVTLKREL